MGIIFTPRRDLEAAFTSPVQGGAWTRELGALLPELGQMQQWMPVGERKAGRWRGGESRERCSLNLNRGNNRCRWGTAVAKNQSPGWAGLCLEEENGSRFYFLSFIIILPSGYSGSSLMMSMLWIWSGAIDLMSSTCLPSTKYAASGSFWPFLSLPVSLNAMGRV